MKKLFFIIPVIVIAACQPKEEKFHITANQIPLEDSTLLYVFDDSKNQVIDSLMVIDGAFSYEGKVDSFTKFWFRTKDFKQYKPFWVENSRITLTGVNDTFFDAKVEGSRIQAQGDAYTRSYQYWSDQLNQLEEAYMGSTQKDTFNLAEFKQKRKELNDTIQNKKKEFLMTHPEYELSSYYLGFLKHHIPKEATREIFNQLAPKVQNNAWGKTLQIYLDKAVQYKVGDTPIDISLPDLNGKPRNLYDYRGKYVLLEFWGSGCYPCRMENPHLRKLYNQYKDKGFEIYGVSLDEQKQYWAKAVKEDSINWVTVSDLKGFRGVVPLSFSISYIPKSFLLNPEGEIIAMDLRSKMLKKELEAIFADK